ncbi:hypothetical protein K7X08_026941 [Anisodus acutangulus]|uniref:Uncharacterized protein n=1 Tax=Anisodus acutangulus TaxID=402998 RepID=A0A9Q1QZM9_9SOLA|nr:hypothetical protein K7X08_026941 [Anisodus acutangulus]
MGDFIEEGIKTGRITNLAALQATSKAIQSDSFGGAIKKRRDGASPVMAVQEHRSNQMPTYQSPSSQPPYYNQSTQNHQPSYYSQSTQSPQPYYQHSPTPYPVYHTQPIYSPPRAPTYRNSPQYQPTHPPQPQNHPPNTPRPRANHERRPVKTYTPLAEPLAQLYERLRTAGILQPIPGHIPNPIPRSYDETKHCAYHSGITGHDTGVCFALKDKIEALIKEGIIQLKGPSPNVNNNPLPNHDNANIDMITVDEENSLEGTIVPIRTEERVESSALITPIITVQVRAPFEVEVLPPKSRIVTSYVDTKTAPWSYSIGERSRGKEKQIVEVVVAGMTRSGRCYAPADNPKKVVTETEVEEFWRKMPTKEYSVVEQLKKTSSDFFAIIVDEFS